MKSISKLLVSDKAWLAALVSPENRVAVDFHRIPAFYTARRGWFTEPTPFGQHLLYCVVSGSFRLREGKKEHPVEPGTLLWIPPWSSFRCWLPDERPASFFRFRLRVESPRGEILARQNTPLLLQGAGAARHWIEEVVRASGHAGGPLQNWRLRAALLGLFVEILSPQTHEASDGQLRPQQREELEKWAHRDGKVQVTPAQLAARLGLSADYFTRLFRKTYGLSPRAWIVRERVRMAAARLLESNLNISEVAGEFGYQNIFFFSRQFKQVMGQSPNHYRRTTSR